MTRLIDANTLKAEFTGNSHENWHYTAVRAMIDVAPTVDAVPVIRCKDCKYYREGKYFESIKFCFRLKHGEEYVGYNFSEDDFCSHAERR